MPSRYWGALLAAIGLALVSFALGCYVVALHEPHEQRYPSYRYAADQPQKSTSASARPTHTQTFEYRTPCNKPKGHDESDLCAQWRAAKAGEDSARWTKWGVWIGIIGSILLLWQIILTRRAVEDTGHATEEMRKANQIALINSETEIRPWIEVIVEAPFRFSTENGKPRFSAKLILKNVGRTPAIDVRYLASMILGPEPKDHVDSALNDLAENGQDHIDTIIFPDREWKARLTSTHCGKKPAATEVRFYAIAMYRTRFSERLRYTAQVYDITDSRRSDGLIDFSVPPYGDVLNVTASRAFTGYAT